MAENRRTTSNQSSLFFPLTGEVFNFNLAKNVLGQRVELAYEMINLLLNSIPENVEQLKKAYQEKNWPQLQHAAHILQGGACYCGTVRLEIACANLETAIKTEQFALADDFFTQLMQEVAVAEKALREHVALEKK